MTVFRAFNFAAWTSLKLKRKIIWEKTGDPEFPLKSKVDGEDWVLRINDFPEEELYTLIINGKENVSFSGWPMRWIDPDE